MSKTTDIKTLRSRKQDQTRSKIVTHDRMVKNAKATGTIERTAIAAGIAAMKNSIQRDQPRQQFYWQTLNGIYDSIAVGIYNISKEIASNHKVVTEAGKADGTFDRLILAAMDDNKTFANRLLAIKGRHKDKSGVITDPVLLDTYYAIGNDYHNLYQELQQLSFQTATEITAYVSSAVTAIDPKENVASLVNKAIADNNSNVESQSVDKTDQPESTTVSPSTTETQS